MENYFIILKIKKKFTKNGGHSIEQAFKKASLQKGDRDFQGQRYGRARDNDEAVLFGISLQLA